MNEQNIDIEKADEYVYLVKLISSLNCPKCGKDKTISVSKIKFIVGVIFISHREIYYRVGCRRCLHKELLKANFVSLLFGWWSIPYGIFHTISSVMGNTKRMVIFKQFRKDYLEFLVKYEDEINNHFNQGQEKLIEFLRKPEKQNSR